MIQSYQNLIHTNIKNNKDQIFGFIIGLLVLLTIFKQSIGLPLLFIFIIAIGGLIKPGKEYLIIASLLVFKIIIITIITKNNLHDINLENIKFLIRRIIVDVVILFMLFVTLKNNTKKGFYYFCVILFLADMGFNLYAHINGVSLYGTPLEIRPKDLIGRAGGLFNHSFYSIDISLIGLFTGIILKNRPLILLAIINCFMSGSQRGFIYIALIIFLYIAFYKKIKNGYIYLMSAILVIGIYFSVSYLAINYPDLNAHNERIFRWTYAYDVITNGLDGFNYFLRLNPEAYIPENISLIKSPFYTANETLFLFNAESYYLSDIINYGFLIGLISIIVFFKIYIIANKSIQRLNFKPGLIQDKLTPIVLAFFIFLDGFLGYSIGAMVLCSYYCLICFNNSQKQD